MAIQKIDVSGATIRIKANGGTVEAVEMYCLEGTWDIDLGAYDIAELECHTGIKYEKGKQAKFGTTSWNGKLDGSRTDEAQILLIQALYNEGDFATDNTMNVEIEFDNSEGTNGTKCAYDIIVKDGKAHFDPKGKLSLNFTIQQTTIPVWTASA